jgi:hypothetical protein
MAFRLEIWFRKNYDTHYIILLFDGLADDSASALQTIQSIETDLKKMAL